MKRNKNGITLIALIITIIVMLILVGVTINLSANGKLFDKARTAKTGTQKEVERETLLQAVIGGFQTNGDFNIKAVKLPEGMKWCDKDDTNYDNTNNDKEPSESGNWVITGNNNKFYVDSNGNITDTAPLTLEEAMSQGWVGVYSENYDEIGIGYGGSENEINLEKIIKNVPKFIEKGENNIQFIGYEDIDVTQSNLEITFIDNENIEKVNFNELEVTLCSECFAGCSNLINITGLNGIKKIPYLMFDENTIKIQSIYLPSNIIEIDERAFGDCTNLTQITINKPENSIEGAPWGATNATVIWTGE